MSFVDFLLKYYVWILGVLVVLIITVIGFLADARSKKKKALKVENNASNNAGNVENNMQEQGAVIPQPVQEQSIMQPEINNLNSGINEMVSPVGDLNLNSNPTMNNSQMETPVQPVMPTVEPVMPNVAPQMETPVQPVMPTAEPVMPNVAPQMETPQSLNDFNAANMFVTGNNNQ